MDLYIYCRVSTSAQEKKYSLPRQKEQGEEYATANGYTPKTFIEARSGKDLENRAQWQKIEAAIRDGSCNALWVVNTDRLTRSGFDNQTLKRLFIEHQVLVIENGVRFDLTNDNDSLLWDMKGTFGEYERRRIIARTKAVREKVLNSGRYIQPYVWGYDLVSNPDGTKKIIINEEEARAVRKMYELALQGLPLTRIAKELQMMGFRGKKGERLYSSNLSRIIRQPYFVGKVRNLQKEHINSVFYPPIVPLETWEQVQKIVRFRLSNGAAKNFNKAKYALSSILKCGNCGAPMFYNWTGNQNGRKPSESYRHLAQSKKERECTNKPKYINKPFMNEIVRRLFREMFADWEDFSTYFETNKHKFSHELEILEIQKKELTERYNVNQANIDKVLDLVMSGTLTKEEVTGRMDKIRFDNEAIQASLTQIDINLRKYAFSQESLEKLAGQEQNQLFTDEDGMINEGQLRDYYIERISSLTLTNHVLRLETIYGISYSLELPEGWYLKYRAACKAQRKQQGGHYHGEQGTFKDYCRMLVRKAVKEVR